MAFNFGKKDKLCSTKLIDEIFSRGKEVKVYPYVLKYLIIDEQDGASVKIAFSVPKKRIRKAVSRNLIRRRMKEAYRLNRADFMNLVDQHKMHLAVFLIYTGKENETYQFIEEKIKLILSEIKTKLFV
ncbi:MAG: ribonuclease P protein component [Crocinitomicaceae bacterium]|nr:ribonuclease P protein component [Crocinitomicaceae bacterium]MBK8927567.1 ribonuclease P protein component [Crocinitomicaceae bacterium]